MKRRCIYYFTAAAATVGILAGGILLVEKTKEQQNLLPELHAAIQTQSITTTTQTEEFLAIATPQTTITDGYFLQLKENTLYVYPKGQAAAIEAYPVESAWLPEYDRVLLQNGLYAENLAALRQLLEDYTS